MTCLSGCGGGGCDLCGFVRDWWQTAIREWANNDTPDAILDWLCFWLFAHSWCNTKAGKSQTDPAGCRFDWSLQVGANPR